MYRYIHIYIYTYLSIWIIWMICVHITVSLHDIACHIRYIEAYVSYMYYLYMYIYVCNDNIDSIHMLHV